MTIRLLPRAAGSMSAIGLATVLATLAPALPAAAQGAPSDTAPRFARIFADHAVLQRGEAIRIWGQATPSHTVTVALNGQSGGQSVSATADAGGTWRAALPATAAGGPYTLRVSDGAASTTLNDIMVGDVFLCTGQSNMEFPVKFATNAWNEVGASANPNLRFTVIPRGSEAAPLSDLKAVTDWKVAGAGTTGDASAVCYYMAKTIQAEQKVPVGMIDSYWGGTIAQAWISEAGLRSLKTYDAGLDTLDTYRTSPDTARIAWARMQRDTWQTGEPDLAGHRQWATPAFDDSGWKAMAVTGFWETSGDPDLAAYDGIVWYRQTLTLTAAEAKGMVHLQLGPVDDSDVTFVNGVTVGASAGWDTPRTYAIPAGVLKAGRNVIVVRVLDTGGGGGFSAGAAARKLVLADGTVKPLAAEWRYRIAGKPLPTAQTTNEPWASPNGLTNLYNAMIAPIAPYTVRAVAWYQGESNTYSPPEYAHLLPALIGDWRKAFAQPDLPFMVVQLSAFGPVATQPGASSWADLREVQHATVKATPHTALTVSLDFGDRSDIHPTQKTIIGQRLARNARAIVYGQPVSPGGPEATQVTRAGNDLVIRFRDTNGGLKTYSSATAIGFETCAGETCQYTIATVSGDTIVLTGANTPDITRVRYAWADAPYTNLYSGDDLPAVPFQMDVTK